MDGWEPVGPAEKESLTPGVTAEVPSPDFLYPGLLLPWATPESEVLVM